MKRIYLLLLVLLIAVLLISCNTEGSDEPISEPIGETDTESISTQEETEQADTSQEPSLWDAIVLEPDKQGLPSYEDLCRIEYNMTYEEVHEILGNPQRMILKNVPTRPGGYITIFSPCYVYESSEDWLLYVAYSSTEERKNLNVMYNVVLKEDTVLLTAEEALPHLREGMTYSELSTKLGQHYSCDKYNFDESILMWQLADDQVLHVYFRDIEAVNLIHVNEWVVSSFKIEENKSTTP